MEVNKGRDADMEQRDGITPFYLVVKRGHSEEVAEGATQLTGEQIPKRRSSKCKAQRLECTWYVKGHQGCCELNCTHLPTEFIC